MSAIWITWERQRRNRSMAARVGARLHELHCARKALRRYWLLGRQTIRIVRESGAAVIFYQNPSLVLASLLATMKFLRLTGARLIGDFHNAGVHPPVGGFLVRWIVRNSDLVIVSNRNLEPAITALGGQCLSIPDPIPDIEPADATSAGRHNPFRVFFICSWAADEPIVNVLRAAQILEDTQSGISVAITGRPRLERIGWHAPVPANVVLTGFLAEEEFDRQLATASAVLDLTTRANCMVCGAYEAVSAEVPLIASDNEPTRRYFRKGTLYTDNSAEDIARCILELRDRHPAFKAEIVQLKQELRADERAALNDLLTIVSA